MVGKIQKVRKGNTKFGNLSTLLVTFLVTPIYVSYRLILIYIYILYIYIVTKVTKVTKIYNISIEIYKVYIKYIVYVE